AQDRGGEAAQEVLRVVPGSQALRVGPARRLRSGPRAHLEAARALAPPYGMDAALLEEALARAYLVRGERERAIQEASVATARAGARPCARVRRASALVKLDASLASP